MGRVFISYAREDAETARRLYEDLKRAKLEPWLDSEDLLPGQEWAAAITRAIKQSSYFLALISSNSVTKRGFVQKELRQGLDLLEETPPGEVFVIPVRLEDVEPQHDRLSKLQWVDLFSGYDQAVQKVLSSMPLAEDEQGGNPRKRWKYISVLGPAALVAILLSSTELSPLFPRGSPPPTGNPGSAEKRFIVFNRDDDAIAIWDASFYLGPLSGVAKGVPLAMGAVRKFIPWSDVKSVQFLDNGLVVVTRVDGRTLEGKLRIHAFRRDLLGADVLGDQIRIPVSEIGSIKVE